MTGFARSGGEAEWGSWVWEGKSVNGKGLDIRCHLPSGLEQLEKYIKNRGSDVFSRGNFQVSLRIKPAFGDEAVSVNSAVLKGVLDAYEAQNGGPATDKALATLFTVRGVVESQPFDGAALAEDAAAIAVLEASGAELLQLLKSARDDEGRALHKTLVGHLSEISGLTKQASELAGKQVAAIAAQYRERLSNLDSERVVSDERLAAEIAVLAAKADVTEEIDRLSAHVESGIQMVGSGASVGRNLGFLAQELNREANTLCSKSASLDLTNTGLALKSVIDQFKEQAANVE